MSNTDNLYPINKSTLLTVRFDPLDSCYLRSDSYLRLDNILKLVQCRAMQEVRHTGFRPSLILPCMCMISQMVRSID